MGGVCDDSRLCDELAGTIEGVAFHELCRGDPPSRVIHATRNFSVVADLAPLTEGHLLLLTNWHATSFGQVPEALWPELMAEVSRAARALSDAYRPPIILEHGSASCGNASPCISHAHWHLLPLEIDPTHRFRNDGLEGASIGDFQELRNFAARDEAYLFYADTSKGISMCFNRGLSNRHQYIRLTVGSLIGLEDP